MNTENSIPETLAEGSGILNNDTFPDDIRRLKAQLQDMQTETNTLKNKCSLLLSLRKMRLSKSSYYYQKTISAQDKYI